MATIEKYRECRLPWLDHSVGYADLSLKIMEAKVRAEEKDQSQQGYI